MLFELTLWVVSLSTLIYIILRVLPNKENIIYNILLKIEGIILKNIQPIADFIILKLDSFILK